MLIKSSHQYILAGRVAILMRNAPNWRPLSRNIIRHLIIQYILVILARRLGSLFRPSMSLRQLLRGWHREVAMRVLKVTLEGITTSFRYPHFMTGVQPSFPVPPPSTIYGHICSALGEWVDPEGLAFAYHFTAQESVVDLEHIHVLSASTGKLPGSQYPKVLEG